MPFPNWLQLLVMVFFLGAVLDIPWLVYFSVSVFSVMGLAMLWRDHALDRISYTRRFHYRRGFPGETTRVDIEVINQKPIPLSWLHIQDAWPLAVSPDDDDLLAPSHIHGVGNLVNAYSLRWFDRARREYSLRFQQRGIYAVGPVTLESGDLFGIYSQTRELNNMQFLSVFPELLSLESLSLAAEDPFGDRRASRPLFEDPNLAMGVRPYHPEDGFRRIHWPATARTGTLQTRVYQPVTAHVMAVCLNVSTDTRPWLTYSPAMLEYMVKVAGTLAYHGIQNGYTVGLYTNGCLAYADHAFRIQPGRTQEHLARLLEALAGVTPYTSGPFDKFLLNSMSDVPYGASLVLITSMLPDSLLDTLLRLRRYRRNMLLFKVGDEPPPTIPGIRTIHLPFTAEEPHG